MLVSVIQCRIQVNPTTYRHLKIALDFIPTASIWTILIVASLFVVQIGHYRRSSTPTMRSTGCFKPLAELARDFMTIIDAFFRSRVGCVQKLIPSMAQDARVQPGEIPSVRRQREFLIPRRYLEAGSETQTRKAALIHSWAAVLKFLGPVRGSWLGVVEDSASIARWHVLGEATLFQTPSNTDAFPELELCEHLENLRRKRP